MTGTEPRPAAWAELSQGLTGHPRTYITAEVVVIGDGEICQVPQAHLPAPDSVHDEDV